MRKELAVETGFAQAEKEGKKGILREGESGGGRREDNDKDVKMEKGRRSVNAQEFSQSAGCMKASRKK